MNDFQPLSQIHLQCSNAMNQTQIATQRDYGASSSANEKSSSNRFIQIAFIIKNAVTKLIRLEKLCLEWLTVKSISVAPVRCLSVSLSFFPLPLPLHWYVISI